MQQIQLLALCAYNTQCNKYNYWPFVYATFSSHISVDNLIIILHQLWFRLCVSLELVTHWLETRASFRASFFIYVLMSNIRNIRRQHIIAKFKTCSKICAKYILPVCLQFKTGVTLAKKLFKFSNKFLT